MECLNTCSKPNDYQTVTIVASQRTCCLFGDRLSNGQLIVDSAAETISVDSIYILFSLLPIFIFDQRLQHR